MVALQAALLVGSMVSIVVEFGFAGAAGIVLLLGLCAVSLR